MDRRRSKRRSYHCQHCGEKVSKTWYYEHKKAYYNKDAGAWIPSGACDTNPTVSTQSSLHLVNDFEFSSDEDLQASNVSTQRSLHLMNDFEFSDDEDVQASKWRLLSSHTLITITRIGFLGRTESWYLKLIWTFPILSWLIRVNGIILLFVRCTLTITSWFCFSVKCQLSCTTYYSTVYIYMYVSIVNRNTPFVRMCAFLANARSGAVEVLKYWGAQLIN